jgi:hypothetical protein
MSSKSGPDTAPRSRWLAPLLVVVIGLAAPIGYLAWRGLLPGGGGIDGTDERGTAAVDPEMESGEIVENRPGVEEMVLYFTDSTALELVAERRDVAESDDVLERARAIVHELSAGSFEGLSRTIPLGVEAHHLFWDGEETLYLDLSGELLRRHPGGTRAELLSLRSLRESLRANLPAVRRVRFLIDGEEQESLRGHISLQAFEETG